MAVAGVAWILYSWPQLTLVLVLVGALLLSTAAALSLWLRLVWGRFCTFVGAIVAGALPRPAVDRHEFNLDKSSLECSFAAEETVGRTLTFSIKCYDNGRLGYPVKDVLSRLSIEVSAIGSGAAIAGRSSSLPSSASSVPYELSFPPTSANVAVGTFVAYRAGEYRVQALVDGRHVGRSPRWLRLGAGPADAGQSGFTRPRMTLVLCCGGSGCARLPMAFLDAYGNGCTWAAARACLDLYRLRLVDDCTGADRSDLVEAPSLVECIGGGPSRLELRCRSPGLYRLSLAARPAGASGDPRQPPLLNDSARLLALSADDWRRVCEITGKRLALSSSSSSWSASGQTYFKATLLRLRKRGESGGFSERTAAQQQTVYCYPSPRQLAVKMFYLNLLPRRLCTLRNNPSLNVSLSPAKPSKPGRLIVQMADSAASVELEVKDALVLVGCLLRWLLDAAGGSHVFEEKRSHLHEALTGLYDLGRVGSPVQLVVDRQSILATTYAATKRLPASSWSNVFAIKFFGEEGLDYGGLRREWMDLLLSALFDPQKSGLFSYVGNGRAIMPNYCCQLPVKYYAFAGQIVGKCIVENARGGRYALPVRLHFARSFLAQILGFHVDHRAFERDDPELYEKKIKYILECADVADLELTFTDEEDEEAEEAGAQGGGRRRRTVDIAPGGAATAVTNANRVAYADALARHRFCSRVDDKTQAFVGGLFAVVPEHLLTAFDENDLEMLLTGGVQRYSAADMRPHVDVICLAESERRALERFWTVVSGFTSEQMTRLVQFVTGSSLLPPGGFEALQPKISITFDGDTRHLPVSHTCHNNLQLPAYASLEQMRESLQLAIDEGQGFGLA